ncbi:hypothetical protein Taro_001475 [Colocasia esculenta]|uniref:Uncharacterized protein n=1 Tax=Colocasia esculenta TaxID=4460 RepID=A0A843TJ36_COLES|nr:hypothetical protein [Colocasia esculenta]
MLNATGRYVVFRSEGGTPGRHDLVATGRSSPSCSEGDTPVVAFKLFGFLFRLVLFQFLGPCLVCRRWPTDLLGVFPEGVPCVPVLLGLSRLQASRVVSVVVAPPVLGSPGAWHLRACPVQRLSPFSGTPILGSPLRESSLVWVCDAEGFEVLSWRRPDSPLSHCLSLHWFRSHVVVLGVRPQLGQATVLCVLCVSVADLSRPCVGAEAGARLASRVCRLRVPLLATSGGGLVIVVVTAFSSQGFQVFLVARASTAVIARLCLVSVGVIARDGTGVCGSPTWWRVHGPEWFCLWALDLVEESCVCHDLGWWSWCCDVLFRCLVVPCYRLTPPLLPSARGSSSQELGVGRVAEAAVAPCVVNSSESECCCSCYCAACVVSVFARRVRAVAARLALDSLVVVFLVWRRLVSQSRCFVCRVALLVECCYTYLWLLSAWRWLVVGSGEAEVHRLVALCSGGGFPELFVVVLSGALVVLVKVLLGWLLALFGGGCPQGCFLLFWSSLLSLGRDEMSSLPVGLSVLQFASALSVKALCTWPCVWLLRWPACLVVHFQVFSAVLADFVCPCGSSGLLCSCARRALADGGLVSVMVLGWLCFVGKCQSYIVVFPLACGRDSCVSPSSAFRLLLGVVVLHYGVVFPGCASRERCSAVHQFSGWLAHASIVPLELLRFSLPVWQSRCSVFWCAFGADVVVVLLMLSAFRVLPLWVSGGESPSKGPVALSVVRQALVMASVSVFPLALGAIVFGCGTLLSGWHVGTRAKPCVHVAGVLSTLRWFSVMRGIVCDFQFLWLRVRLVSLLDREEGVKASCQVSRSPKAPACATHGLKPVRPIRGLVGTFEKAIGWVSRSSLEGPWSGPMLRLGFCLGSRQVGCRDTRQKVTCRLSLPGGDRLAVAFPFALQFQIRRRHPGRHDLVVTGWPSPSCSEGNTPVVAFRLFGFLFRLVLFRFIGPCLVRVVSVVVAPPVLGSPGAWHLRACPVQRLSPFPGTPILGSPLRESSLIWVWDAEGFGVLSWCRPDIPLSHCLSLRWFRSHVVVLGVRPQLGQAAVLRVLCVSVAALSHPCAGAEAGARLASRACGVRVPLLAASGGGLVVVVTAFSSRHFHVFLDA